MTSAFETTTLLPTTSGPYLNQQHPTQSKHLPLPLQAPSITSNDTLVSSQNLQLSEDLELGEIDWLIDNLFDTGRLHMICAPVASGKTRFLLRLISDWNDRIPVLSRSCHPRSFVYVSGGRDRRSVKVALRSLGINPSTFNLISGLDNNFNIDQFLNSLHISGAEVIFIDNLAILAGIDPTDSSAPKLLKRLKTWCEAHNRTIIFTHPMVKTEVGHKYPSLKSKVAGNSSWITLAETIILLDEENPQFTHDPYRRVELIAKNYKLWLPGSRFRLDEEGRLLPAPSEDKPGGADDEPKDKLLLRSITDQHTSNELVKLSGLPRSTVYRLLDKLLDDGLVRKLANGKWEKLAV